MYDHEDRLRDLDVLHHLALERDRSLTTAQVATGLGLTPADVAACVAGLEAEGLVRRAPSRTDHDVVHLILTPGGLERTREVRHWPARTVTARRVTPADELGI